MWQILCQFLLGPFLSYYTVYHYFFLGFDGGGVVVVVMWISNNPLSLLLPSIMTTLVFTIFRLYLVNNATPSLSHNYPIDIREPVAKSSKMKLCCVSVDNSWYVYYTLFLWRDYVTICNFDIRRERWIFDVTLYLTP